MTDHYFGDAERVPGPAFDFHLEPSAPMFRPGGRGLRAGQ